MLPEFTRRVWPLSRLAAAWQHDIDTGLKPTRKEIRQLQARVSELEALLATTAEVADRGDRFAEQIRVTLLSDAGDGEWLRRIPVALEPGRIRAHVRTAIAAAPLQTEPFDHIVVDGLLPDDAYELVLKARPPAAFFDNRDPVKRDLRMPLAFGPALMKQVWQFVDEVLTLQIIREAILEKFDAPLERHLDALFGAEMRDQVRQLPPARSSGRLALRRPGYALGPHRDPKHSMLTCLIYLAGPGDSDLYGTHLYAVEGDEEADYKQTYFPEAEGHRCLLARTVPYRANSMLVFLNSRGAHGAGIPADAPPMDRYTYQFYIAPEHAALGTLVRTLPRERRAKWQSKDRAR